MDVLWQRVINVFIDEQTATALDWSGVYIKLPSLVQS